jgi:hypothetical protein
MRRAPAAGPSPAEQARSALAALVGALPVATSDSPVERAFAGTERPRDALVALVARAAFALAAEARHLCRSSVPGVSVPGEPLPKLWPFGPATYEPALAATRAALLQDRSLARFAELEPEELGGFYEGLLAVGVELARKDSVVLRQPRPAGGAAEDRLVEVGAGATPRGSERPLRGARVPAGRVALVSTVDRRRSGSHYTPRALTERVVAAALAPILGDAPAPDDVLALRVADPAMGTGAFLVAACRFLAERLLEAEARHGAGRQVPVSNGAAGANGREHASELAERRVEARRRVAERCLFGVDRDALAVEVARQALWLTIGDSSLPLAALERTLLVGEALLGRPAVAPSGRTERAARRVAAEDTLDWERAFAAVFSERAGFDAFVGNPPWVSYAGRAAQPLADDLRAAYAGYEAFRGYRNLQGLFVERCARLLRPGGRLGLVLPSSMSELAGYAPTRRAHDRYCAVDANLGDLGADAFDGVFQPCMVLTSTRRAAPLAVAPDAAWPVERPDLDAVARSLIDKLTRPPLPPHLFGERGLQSTGGDGEHLRPTPDEQHSVPLRSGSDVSAFELRSPSAHADPRWFGPRLREHGEWQRVRLLVRQTARVPVAALSDGAGFRNSLLAGFEDGEHSAAFLVAYLNSTPIRWLHYVRHRDARQGMPQLKISHLRATPAPPSSALVAALDGFGRGLSTRGRGIRPNEQTELDALVADAFELDAEERKRLADFRGVVADAGPPA